MVRCCCQSPALCQQVTPAKLHRGSPDQTSLMSCLSYKNNTVWKRGKWQHQIVFPAVFIRFPWLFLPWRGQQHNSAAFLCCIINSISWEERLLWRHRVKQNVYYKNLTVCKRIWRFWLRSRRLGFFSFSGSAILDNVPEKSFTESCHLGPKGCNSVSELATDPDSVSRRLKCVSLPHQWKYFPLHFPQEIHFSRSIGTSVKYKPRALQLRHFIFTT